MSRTGDRSSNDIMLKYLKEAYLGKRVRQQWKDVSLANKWPTVIVLSVVKATSYYLSCSFLPPPPCAPNCSVMSEQWKERTVGYFVGKGKPSLVNTSMNCMKWAFPESPSLSSLPSLPILMAFSISLPFLPTNNRKQFQCLNIILNHKLNWAIIFGMKMIWSLKPFCSFPKR